MIPVLGSEPWVCEFSGNFKIDGKSGNISKSLEVIMSIIFIQIR